MGVTLGASVFPSTIWRRSSIAWSACRSPGKSSGACSISNAMPSKDELAMAIALSVSTGVNEAKAVLPSSKALITPLRRGMSGMLAISFVKIRRPIADGIATDNREEIVNFSAGQAKKPY